MSTHREVLASEDRFFAALSGRDRDGLERVLGTDFVLIDVMTGSEVPRAVFLDLVGSQRLIFDSIERLDARMRLYGAAAIVTGRTRMVGRYDAQSFRVHSRYTHAYMHTPGGWRLVAAQGTQVAEAGQPEAAS
jgi:uncharacterized protein DUF4440